MMLLREDKSFRHMKIPLFPHYLFLRNSKAVVKLLLKLVLQTHYGISLPAYPLKHLFLKAQLLEEWK